MKRMQLRRALAWAAVLSASAGGAVGLAALPASASTAAPSAAGPYTCYSDITGFGAYSACTPGTYGVEHRVHLVCADGRRDTGSWVGATSRSYAYCDWNSGSDYAWVEQRVQGR